MQMALRIEGVVGAGTAMPKTTKEGTTSFGPYLAQLKRNMYMKQAA
jgi:hypothetical protein